MQCKQSGRETRMKANLYEPMRLTQLDRGQSMKFARLTLLAVAIAAFALLFAQPGPALAVTFTINSTGDAGDPTPDGVCATAGGVCTLRAAIQESNAQAGADVINFNIPGAGPHTIALASALPTITQPLTIDGFSQPGS